jgi:uncharacterized protein (DUF1684 family)
MRCGAGSPPDAAISARRPLLGTQASTGSVGLTGADLPQRRNIEKMRADDETHKATQEGGTFTSH